MKCLFRSIYVVFLFFNSCLQQRWVQGNIVYFDGDTIGGRVLKNWKGSSIPENGLITIRYRENNSNYIAADSSKSIASVRLRSKIYRQNNLSWRPQDTVYMPDSCITLIDVTVTRFLHPFLGIAKSATYEKGTLSTLHALLYGGNSFGFRFARLLLSTTYYELYETDFDRPRFFFALGRNPGMLQELCRFIVATPNNGCVPYDDYRIFLRDQYEYLKKDHRLIVTDESSEEGFMRSVAVAKYDRASLIGLVQELNRLRGGEVLYRYRP